MHIAENFSDIDFESIPIDPFWNLGDQKENKMHRIHAYPAKFPAFITTKALEYANKKGVEVNLIADIFCGCGTVAYETSRNGKDFWGCDINPIATLIAETKSKKYSPQKIDIYYSKILDNFKISSIDTTEIEKINNRIKYWYKDTQICDLLKLKYAIFSSVPKNSYYLKFFLCAFSNILKSTSMWLTKSIKPQIDPNKNPANVLDAFKSQFYFMKKANNENESNKNSNINIENISFLKKKINSAFADLVITSPPYVTSYEYADLHQLSTLWLDFSKDYKIFRKGTIGSIYHDTDFKNDVKQLNKTGRKIAVKLYGKDQRKAHSTAKYFVDIQESITQTFKLLRKNGLALFVIGNTEYKSVLINNAKHLVESMISSGFKDIEVSKRKISKKILTPFRDNKGKFTTDSNSRKVYAEEFIIVGKKI